MKMQIFWSSWDRRTNKLLQAILSIKTYWAHRRTSKYLLSSDEFCLLYWFVRNWAVLQNSSQDMVGSPVTVCHILVQWAQSACCRWCNGPKQIQWPLQIFALQWQQLRQDDDEYRREKDSFQEEEFITSVSPKEAKEVGVQSNGTMWSKWLHIWLSSFMTATGQKLRLPVGTSLKIFVVKPCETLPKGMNFKLYCDNWLTFLELQLMLWSWGALWALLDLTDYEVQC